MATPVKKTGDFASGSSLEVLDKASIGIQADMPARYHHFDVEIVPEESLKGTEKVSVGLHVDERDIDFEWRVGKVVDEKLRQFFGKKYDDVKGVGKELLDDEKKEESVYDAESEKSEDSILVLIEPENGSWEQFDKKIEGKIDKLPNQLYRLLDDMISLQDMKEMVSHPLITAHTATFEGGNPFNDDFFKRRKVKFTNIIQVWSANIEYPKLSTLIKALLGCARINKDQAQQIYEMIVGKAANDAKEAD